MAIGADHIRSNLRPGERLDFIAQFSIMPSYVGFGGAALAIIGVLWFFDAWDDSLWILAAFLGGGGVVLLYLMLQTEFTEFGITDQRVVVRHGIVARKVREINHRSIESVNVDQSVVGRLLGYGKLTITGRGTADIEVEMDTPFIVRKKLRHRD